MGILAQNQVLMAHEMSCQLSFFLYKSRVPLKTSGLLVVVPTLALGVSKTGSVRFLTKKLTKIKF
jgi:hypothetical protein